MHSEGAIVIVEHTGLETSNAITHHHHHTHQQVHENNNPSDDEKVPLILPVDGGIQNENKDAEEEDIPRTTGSIVKEITLTAIPMAGSSLLWFGNQAIMIGSISHHLGTDLLAAYSVSSSIFNVAALSLCIGFFACLDTLCSQAFGRNPTGNDVSLLLQRGLWLGAVASAIFVGLLFVAGPIITAVFTTSTIASEVAEFLRYLSVYFVITNVTYCLQRALQCQGLSLAVTASEVVGLGMAVVGSIFLVPYGIMGVCGSMTCSITASLIVCLAYGIWHPESIIFRRVPLSLVLDRKGIKDFCTLGFASMVSICSDWWSFEALTLIMARYGTETIASLNISMNIILIMLATPSGVGEATCVLVGNALGRKEVGIAKRTSVIGYGCFLMVLIIDAGVILMFLAHIVRIYTHHAAVADIITGGSWVLAWFHISDNTQLFMSSLARGVGEQAKLPKITIPTFGCCVCP